MNDTAASDPFLPGGDPDDPDQSASLEEPPYLVAIGASAGGLEALGSLFAKLRRDLGSSYLVVQHLSPSHRSMLVPLIARTTTLRVQEVEDGDRPIPDVIHIVPPNCDVWVEEGRLRLRPPEKDVHPVPSVNMLLRSLAKEKGPRAVAIILSGTGSDGADGVRAVHGAGGQVFIQAPSSAKYPSMPQAAIRTGCAHRVLSPDHIAAALADLVEGTATVPLAEVRRAPGGMETLVTRLRERTQIDFGDFKRTTFRRRLQRRQTACQVSNLGEYLAYIDVHPEELDLLCQDLLISVTSFFRDPTAFDALKTELARVVAARGTHERLRLWVPGCATGEEVYSIAIVLAEVFGNKIASHRCQIFATDIDAPAMKTARRAVYPRAALRNVSEERIETFFSSVEDGFQVKKYIRDLVVFARHDLARDPPFGRMDLISCRNVLIYFNAALQARVLDLFHFALQSEGLLFLGRSEGVSAQEAMFFEVDRSAHLYRSRGGARLISWTPPARSAKAMEERVKQPHDGTEFLALAAQAYLPPSVLVNERNEVVHVIGNVAPYLTLSPGRATLQLSDLIHADLHTEFLTLSHRARSSSKACAGRARTIETKEGTVAVRLRVCPVNGILTSALLVFETVEGVVDSQSTARSENDAALENELRITREHLQTLIEELETSNEELQSVNEELQATNEELQTSNEELETSNEELQSTNEGLVTVNEELEIRSSDLATAYADLEHIQHSIGYALIAVDLEFSVVRVNASARRLFSVEAPATLDEIQRHVADPYLEPLLNSVMAERRTDEHSVTVVDHIYALRVSPWVGQGGVLLGAILTFVDRTALVLAERSLKESHSELLAVMENSSAFIAVTDPTGKVSFANRRFLEAFGLLGREVLGTPLFDLLPPSVAEPYRRAEVEVLRRRETIESETAVELRDGSHVVLLTSRFPLFSHEDNVRGVVMVSVDITARRKAEAEVQAQRAFLRSVIDALTANISVIDGTGRILMVNDAWERFGQSGAGEPTRSTAPGANYLEITRAAARTERSAEEALAAIESVLRGQAESARYEYPCRMPDGDRWFTMTITPLMASEGGAVISHTDTTESRLGADRLRLVAAVFESASEGILILDGTGSVLTANQAALSITGYAARDLVGRGWRSLRPHLAQTQTKGMRTFIGGLRRDGAWRGEIWATRPSGRQYPVWLNVRAVRDPEGPVRNYVAMFSDITRLKDAEHNLYRLAYYDELTELPNRTLFQEKIDHAIDLAKRSNRSMALLFIDLDRFKLINDTLGHDAGDALLRAAAMRLKECVRRSDLVARLGGDEFVVMLEELRHAEDAAVTAQKVIAVLSHPFNLNGLEMQVSASIGITLYPEDAENASGLIKNADTAMYRAKERGRNGYQFFTADLHQRSQRRLWLETELRHAMPRGELQLVFQVQTDTKEPERVRALEALLRWEHPDNGWIPPVEFIPVAEETGLIVGIGEWVLHRACHRFRQAIDAGATIEQMAVNVSPYQLREPGFATLVATTLGQHGLTPAQLELEITESALLQDQAHARETIDELHKLGVKLALDDFGTGFSSLTTLQSFPVSTVKIDRTFVRDIVRDANDATLVRAVMGMGEVLGLQVIAEGVETPRHMEMLRGWGCRYMQGFVNGPGLSEDQLRSGQLHPQH
jgi:diguanylate cyclase (GGDEF)-like protein/PAS domain S-box-containing protein